MTTRRVELEGPLNFRDLGGYVVADSGHRVRWGRLYRSDSLHHLTPADGPRLAELGIRTAVDFRANDELDRLGIGPVGDLSIRHVHCPTTDRIREAAVRDWAEARSAADVYLSMIEFGGPAYAEALRTVADADALPAVFFCVAGKDRTGCFAAMVLGLLGVSDDDVVADYALTQEVVAEIIARRVPLTEEEEEAAREQYGHLPQDLREAQAASMESLLVRMRERWGDWEGYVDALGIGPDIIAGLRTALLEPDAPG